MHESKENVVIQLLKAGELRADSDGRVWEKRGIGWRSCEELTSNNYCRVCVTYCGIRYRVRTHRLVWILANGPIPHGYQINHKDGKRTNNVLSNLEIVTPGENIRHAIHVLGDWHRTKLDETQVREIRAAIVRSCGIKELARRYFVAPHTIRNIRDGRTWAHVAI